MYLEDALKGIGFSAACDISGLEIANVRDDSRLVGRGDMFIAVRGHSVDGAQFINDAVRKGAMVVVSENDFDAPQEVKKIIVKDARSAVPVIAGNFYAEPWKRLKVVGVTGTNGKTTITYLIENIIKAAGEDVGVIGTINYRVKDRVTAAANTTPGPLGLASFLADMASLGVRYAAMEVSSHALDQGRVDGILFDVGIFSNITSDHLDYHKSVAGYFRAKAGLFERLKENGVAILNSDDRKVMSLKGAIGKRVLTYGIEGKADIRAEDIKLSLAGSSFTVLMPGGLHFSIHTRLIGRHNISNILAAAAASCALNIKNDAFVKGIMSFTAVPGRLEEVNAGQPFKVLVDYAHTEDALFNILGLLREVAKRRIITVFGCGGDRDRTKRPLMGRVACKLSHHVIITSDNPRFEEPQDIIDEIEKGVEGDFSNYDIVIDRREAIEKAIRLARADDIVIIAGKGHETYQIIKDRARPFDDREIARQILELGKMRCL